MTSHRVFVYGSLLRGLHNHHRLSPGSDSTLISAAVTASPFVLVDSGSGYPYALAADRARSIDEPAQLKGELYEVTDELLHSSLDPLEGHPDYYRRGIIDLAEGLGQAALYLLHSEPRIREIRSDGSGLAFAPVAPAGDWRSHLASVRAAQAWPPTRDTVQSEGARRSPFPLQMFARVPPVSVGASLWVESEHRQPTSDTCAGPHAVFSYGCNSLEELRERCSNPLLEAEAAELLGAMRVFGGASARWGGAVASVRPRTGEVVHGQVAWLSSAELEQLDSFEGTDAWSRERTAEPNQPRQLCRAN